MSPRRIVSGFGLQAMLLAVALAGASGAKSQTAQPLEQAFAASLMEMPAGKSSTGGSFHVPAYSGTAADQSRERIAFSVTLSIHNTSESQPLILRRIAYVDAAGNLVASHLTKPVAVKPFATVEVHVAASERRDMGGNFVVDWAAIQPITEPAVAALMIGSAGAAHYSFISHGRALKVVGQ